MLGLASPPPLEAKTVGKMGLKGVPGLTIGGGGGGRRDLAEAGGKDGERLDEALRSSRQAVERRMEPSQ